MTEDIEVFSRVDSADADVAQPWPTLLLHCCGSRHYRLSVYHVAILLAADHFEWQLLTVLPCSREP